MLRYRYFSVYLIAARVVGILRKQCTPCLLRLLPTRRGLYLLRRKIFVAYRGPFSHFGRRSLISSGENEGKYLNESHKGTSASKRPGSSLFNSVCNFRMSSVVYRFAIVAAFLKACYLGEYFHNHERVVV